MQSLTASLAEEHRAIDAALDRLAESVASGQVAAAILREVSELLSRHYRREEEFLARFEAHDAALAAKMRSQHDEASEIAVQLEESLAANHAGDTIYLARRFLAIARHNMIEEERDVFPLFVER